MKRTQVAALLAATAISLAACAGIAFAHVTLENREAKIGAGYKAVFKIPHGCDGSATTAVSIAVPEGVIGVKPMPKAGWTLAVERGAYVRPYKHYHGDLSEGAKLITWRGGPLADEFYDEFVLSTFVAGELTAGTTLTFPVTQTCEKGSLAWTDVAPPGADAHALEHPAPTLRLVENIKTAAAPAPAPSASAAAPAPGPVAVASPWTRATPGGASVAGGYVTLTNTAKEPDRLIGATLERAKSVEIHMMTNDMGVMKMRQMTEGVALPPGVAVELKPGGLHLMLMGLTEPLKAGDSVKGTLTFEKAGTVDVEFAVAPLGADAPPAGGGHDHHHH